MSNFTIAGLISCVAAFVLLLFQSVSGLMGAKGFWEILTLVKAVGEEKFQWIENISWPIIQYAVNYFVTMPLYVLLFCVGVLLLIVGQLTRTI